MKYILMVILAVCGLSVGCAVNQPDYGMELVDVVLSDGTVLLVPADAAARYHSADR